MIHLPCNKPPTRNSGSLSAPCPSGHQPIHKQVFLERISYISALNFLACFPFTSQLPANGFSEGHLCQHTPPVYQCSGSWAPAVHRGPTGFSFSKCLLSSSLMRSPATTAALAQAVRLGETRDGHLTGWWEAREEEGLANEGMKKDASGRRTAACANEQ